MKKIVILSMLAAMVAPVLANETKLSVAAPGVSGVSIYGGWMRHTSSNTRAGFGDTGYNIGIDYALPMNNMGSGYMGETSVGLWYSRHSRSADVLETWAAMLWNRIPFSTGGNVAPNGIRLYGLTGVGVFFHRAVFAAASTRATRFGGVLGVGAGMNKLAIEAGLRWSGSVGGFSTDALFINGRIKF